VAYDGGGAGMVPVATICTNPAPAGQSNWATWRPEGSEELLMAGAKSWGWENAHDHAMGAPSLAVPFVVTQTSVPAAGALVNWEAATSCPILPPTHSTTPAVVFVTYWIVPLGQ
jgi:hypothetical protein